MLKIHIEAKDLETLDRLFRYVKTNLETREHSVTWIEYLTEGGRYKIEIDKWERTTG